MTHVYTEYAARINVIDFKQKDAEEWLHGKDSVFADVAINQQYPSIDKFQKAINYYIRKNTDKPVEVVTIEAALLFWVGYVKFVSTDDIAKLFNNEEAGKKLIDGLYRIKKKGYVAK